MGNVDYREVRKINLEVIRDTKNRNEPPENQNILENICTCVFIGSLLTGNILQGLEEKTSLLFLYWACSTGIKPQGETYCQLCGFSEPWSS